MMMDSIFSLEGSMKEDKVKVDPFVVEGILKDVLKKRFPGDFERQRIVHRVDRLSVCCPKCGDSQDARKKRGNLYLSTLHFVCYNGGCDAHTDIMRLAKDFDVHTSITEEEATGLRRHISETRDNIAIERSRRRELSLEAITNKEYLDMLVNRTELMNRLRLIDVDPRSYMGNYLIKRCQYIDDRFAWDPRKKRLYIFNTDESGQNVFAFQTRQMEGGSKYLTYNLSGMLTKVMGITDETIIQKAKDIDHVSTAFNCFRINFNQTITIFEGPMDSFLYQNSVGLCSIGNKWPFDVDNYRLFQDNDPAGRDKALEMLQDDRSVFLWKKFLDDYSLHDKRIKDYNDIVIYGKANGIKFGTLDEYFSTHKYDGIHL